MKKVLFLMFLLFLMVLETAGVKAQVRIGGNTAPSKAAVLDLNASDAANTGTGGLVLPRVDLKTNTMQLTTGVANLTGTMVYDVTATLGAIGIYFWNGNSWVKASLPSTSVADSGKFLMSNGSSLVLSTLGWITTPTQSTATITGGGTTTWSEMTLSGSASVQAWGRTTIPAPGLGQECICNRYTGLNGSFLEAWPNALVVYSFASYGPGSYSVRCYCPNN